MAALFITMTFLGTSNSSGVQPIVAIERPVFYRERAAGTAVGWGLVLYCLRLTHRSLCCVHAVCVAPPWCSSMTSCIPLPSACLVLFAAGMYSALPFGFAQVLVEVPYCILQV